MADEVNTPIGVERPNPAPTTQAKEPTYTQVSNPRTSVRDYLGEVRLIRDGADLVDSDYTNRPHEDIMKNIDTLANIADIIALDSQGEWSTTRSYSKGAIVSFLSEYFVSLIDNNTAHVPIPSSAQKNDQYWKCVANAKDIITRDYTYKEGTDAVATTQGYLPFTNGKALRYFKLEAGRRYTLIMMSRGNPFKESFSIYFDFESQRNAVATMSADVSPLAELLADEDAELPQLNDPRYPAVSYIECDITYTGLKYSQNGLDLPEIRFKSVNDSVMERTIDLKDAYTPVYDVYGHYGVVFQSVLRNDGLVAVTVTPKWDCLAILAGAYNISPYFSDETGSITGTPKVSVTYRVRPFGGDNGEPILTSYIPAIPLTSKMAWDYGFVKLKDLGVTSKATATVTLEGSDYHKVIQLANQLNYNGDIDSSKLSSFVYTNATVDLSKCFNADAQVVGDNYVKLF